MTPRRRPFPFGRVAFDYETTGLDPWKGARIFLAGMEDEAGNLLLSEPGDSNWGRHMAVLADRRIDKFAWNGSFDMLMALETGLRFGGQMHDGMLLTYMDNEYEPNLKLKDVAHRHLGIAPTEEKEIKTILAGLRRRGKRNANYSDVPRPRMRVYLEGDLDRTIKEVWHHEHVITGPQRRVYDIEKNVIPDIVEMRRWGVHIDREYCKRAIVANQARILELQRFLYDQAGVTFKYGGPQLGQVMESLGLDTGVRNKNGSMKTGQEYLHGVKGHPFMQALLELRALAKLTGTYFEAFLEHETDGVIHPNFWPFGSEEHGIKTGRFSSSDPNFQNIPGGGRGNNVEMLKDPGLVRRAVTPRPGYVFLLADYRQIEFLLFACAAGAERLLEDVRRGVDFHAAAAKLIFGANCFDGLDKDATKRLRFQAKELNFSLIFGMGTRRYAQRAGLTLQEAQARKNTYFSNLPEARDFMLRSQADLLRDGYVQDQWGRRYHVPKDMCFKAANVLCQGPAALVNKRGIHRVAQKIKGLDAHLCMTIHDELILECRKKDIYDAKVALVEGMEDHEHFPVPLTVDVSVAAQTWADKITWVDSIYAKQTRKTIMV